MGGWRREKSAAHEVIPTVYATKVTGLYPIIYRDEYNISFMYMEKLHPFDSGKWGKIFKYLKEAGVLNEEKVIKPSEATEKDLLYVHTKEYLNSLKWSINVAKITEVPPVAILPNFLVQQRVLRPFRYQTSGSILAGKLAIENGWAVNIGGGFHHCSSGRGGGFCAYADITLCIRYLFDTMPDIVKSAMIVDLDAHQGNGHERDFMNDDRVYIMDVYNQQIYPNDGFAENAIKRKVKLFNGTRDEEYLHKVEANLEEALQEFTPNIIVFNAGTDILVNDPLGLLRISSSGIIQRDEIVFTMAARWKIPIVMLTSGGYQQHTSRVIADSILNLRNKQLISLDACS